MTASPETNPVPFEGVTPILPVADAAASIDYYTTKLGFRLDWKDAQSGFASVSRGKCHIFLCPGDQGHPGTWIWVGVGNADALLEEYRRTGAKKFATFPQIIPGPTKCKSKIPTATSSASPPNQRKTNLQANGSICTAATGPRQMPARSPTAKPSQPTGL